MAVLLPSLIYVPDMLHSQAWIDACYRHCQTHGYNPLAIVRHWEDAVKMILAGKAAVAVTGQRRWLPPNRTPRLEVISEPETFPEKQLLPGQRRLVRVRNLEADR